MFEGGSGVVSMVNVYYPSKGGLSNEDDEGIRQIFYSRFKPTTISLLSL